MSSSVVRFLTVAVAAMGLSAPALAFEPSRNVDMIAPASAGGGTDLNARTIADVIKSDNLASANFQVINKPGGSGAVAFSYAATKSGDDHMLMPIAIGQIISSYALDWEVKAKDMTPIATVANDEFFLGAVKGRFKDAKEAVEAAKSGKITFGSSQKGNSDHLAYLLLNKNAKTKFRYVQFGGSGEVMSALLGGHVDVGLFNPSEFIGQVRAGTVVPLASFSTKRMTGDLWKDVPTFTELGYPGVVAAETRVVLGPPKMDKDAVAYYEALLRRVTETERWKTDYIARNNLSPMFLDSKETADFLAEVIDRRVPIFKEAGF